VPKPAVNSAAAKRLAEAFFLSLDENEDGRLSGTEIDPEMKPYDVDNNGKITREEFVAGEATNPDADPSSVAMALLIGAFHTGDVRPFFSVMSGKMRLTVDEPVLHCMIAAFRQEYGDIATMKDDVRLELVTDGKSSEELAMGVTFTKGTDEGELKVITAEGEVLGFNVRAPLAMRIYEVMYARLLSDKELARTVGEQLSGRGKEFVELAAAGKDAEAYARFHSTFQQQVKLDAVTKYLGQFREAAGAISAVEWSSVTCKTGADGKPEQRLLLDYDVVGANGKFNAQVKVEFVGFQAVIVGFFFEKAE
jgi:hypothetical protein